MEPLAPARYQVRFTASAELHEKLERLQALMRSSVPDGGRCAYRDRHGRRCGKRHDLEFHHKHPFALGGDHSPSNLTLMCKSHDTLMAEEDYGEDVVARFRAATSCAFVPVDAYGARIVVQPRRVFSE